MAVFRAEDIRNILDKLDEYVTSADIADAEVIEAVAPAVDTDFQPARNGKIAALAIDKDDTDDADDTDDQKDGESIDDVLTKPAGLEKVVGNINPEHMMSLFGIPEDKAMLFRSAVAGLRKDPPKINNDQGMLLATAFDHMLVHGLDKKTDFDNMLRQARGTIHEEAGRYNPNFTDAVGAKELGRMMHQAAQMGPGVDAAARSLADVIKAGQEGRNLDDGVEGVYNAVVFAIKLAQGGDRSSLLHMLDDFESKYEGDHYAFDPDKWPALMSGLKKLGREILASATKK